MSFLYLEIVAIAACLAVLFLLSLLEGSIIESSPLTLRTMQERDDIEMPPLVRVVLDNKMQLLVPLHMGIQATLIATAILTAHLCLVAWPVWGAAYAFLILLAFSTFFRQLVPRLLTQNEPERKLVTLLRRLHPLYQVLHAFSLPVLGLLRLFKRLYQEAEENGHEENPEATDEEIQAYLEIGEDEGIIEKEDSRLIQSVVEFGDTLAREVMTPRTKIVACREGATIGELRDVMVDHRHSRIPIYRGDIDHIIGVAYIRQLLAHYSKDGESEPITSLIHPALFVPETKKVSALLKELQARGDHTAIVINEFGGVAGLVTIEDLVEEIVGEIWDEDQMKVREIIEESPRSYIVRGSTELYHLEELAGKKFEGLDASTVGGLVTSYLGRVPSAGEEFDLEGIKVHVLDADRRRLLKIRIQLPQLTR